MPRRCTLANNTKWWIKLRETTEAWVVGYGDTEDDAVKHAMQFAVPLGRGRAVSLSTEAVSVEKVGKGNQA